MRKEVLYAILAGISIGLIAAFGTWKVSKLVKVTPPPVIKAQTPTPKVIDSISIDGYKNYDVVIDNPVIKGLYSPNTDIVISTETNDYYVKSNSEGEFEKQIEVPSGLSEIKINETKLKLIYSTEVELGRVGFVGTVTDIASGSIQIKNDKGEIKQISVNDSTTYINSLKKNAIVKITDLAIGDYIVTMGIVSTSKVLDAERILISSPLVENKQSLSLIDKIQVEKITIEKLSKTMINDIKIPTKWNGPNIKELKVGEDLIIVGITKGEKFDLRSIFVVE